MTGEGHRLAADRAVAVGRRLVTLQNERLAADCPQARLGRDADRAAHECITRELATHR